MADQHTSHPKTPIRPIPGPSVRPSARKALLQHPETSAPGKAREAQKCSTTMSSHPFRFVLRFTGYGLNRETLGVLGSFDEESHTVHRHWHGLVREL